MHREQFKENMHTVVMVSMVEELNDSFLGGMIPSPRRELSAGHCRQVLLLEWLAGQEIHQPEQPH